MAKKILVRGAKKSPVKNFTMFKPFVLSRHGTHDPLRGKLALLPFKSCVRLGSTTPKVDDVTHGGNRIECNTVSAVRTSASKLLMKQAFIKAGVITPEMWVHNPKTGHIVQIIGMADNVPTLMNAPLPYPIVAKHVNGSRGTGNYLLKTAEAFEAWKLGRELTNYIFEKFYSYTREYRLHVTKHGCFYTNRKMLKKDSPKEKAWQRHDDNCSWILETNPMFQKPNTWNLIVADCVKALNTVGLDIGAFDVKVQSHKDANGAIRPSAKWIIIESCSAPSFGEGTLSHYLEQIPKILKEKFVNK